MRKIISFMHTSLDGFVAGLNGEMEWIKLDDEMFDDVNKMTQQADTALYGRKTYELMESYWPTAADKPNASKHDIEHSTWYNKIQKLVLSRTLDQDKLSKTNIISDNLFENISHIKQESGTNILIFGSPSATYSLLNEELIDEFWYFVNPIILGQGIPLFKEIKGIHELKLLESKIYPCGVIALHYAKV